MHGSEAVLGNFGAVVAHGLVGGMSSEMQGSGFGSGFLAAAFTKGVGKLEGIFSTDIGTLLGRTQNAIMAAILGGTASVIGGGKFANGAVTGAMSRLLNDLFIEGKVTTDKKGRKMFTGTATLTDELTGDFIMSGPVFSGADGKGALQEGPYFLDNWRARSLAIMTITDPNGKLGYSFDLEPLFDTDRKYLRWHPTDYENTRGCVAPTTLQRVWQSALQSQVKLYGGIPTFVKYKND